MDEMLVRAMRPSSAATSMGSYSSVTPLAFADPTDTSPPASRQAPAISAALQA